jgi:hypothetical protein
MDFPPYLYFMHRWKIKAEQQGKLEPRRLAVGNMLFAQRRLGGPERVRTQDERTLEVRTESERQLRAYLEGAGRVKRLRMYSEADKGKARAGVVGKLFAI